MTYQKFKVVCKCLNSEFCFVGLFVPNQKYGGDMFEALHVSLMWDSICESVKSVLVAKVFLALIQCFSYPH